MTVKQGRVGMTIPVWLWCIPVAAVLITVWRPTSMPTLEKITYNTPVTWKLDYGEDSKPFKTFLTNLRGTLQAGEVCKFPAMVIKPSKAKEFVLVDIVNTKQRTVTLVLQGNDSYFLGYSDTFNGAARANFVFDNQDKFRVLKESSLFPNALPINRLDLPFASSYSSMEKVGELGAGGRKNLELGISNIDNIINIVYGADYQSKKKPKNIGRDLARFGLMVVQMVSEAARFIPIENEVVSKGLSYNSFFPDDNMIALEKEWGKISQAIHVSAAAKPPCVKVGKLDYPPNVDTVEGLRPYITLLKFKDS